MPFPERKRRGIAIKIKNEEEERWGRGEGKVL